MDNPTLLVATVGGSLDPVAVSLGHWQPARALFVASPETRGFVPRILALAEERFGFRLPPGADDVVVVPGAEDVTSGIRCIRRRDDDVRAWTARGEGFRVVVDITAGTKAMAAALVLAARQWECTLSYVGGEDRTKDGVGVVMFGQEKVLYSDNPWTALGYQAAEEAALLFNGHAYAAAARILREAENRITEKRPRQELSALRELCNLLDAWDRFQPGDALKRLNALVARHNDLAACLGAPVADRVLATLAAWNNHLETLKSESRSWAHVADLFANADRRAAEGRYDDAVARLYRALEANAQVRLAEAHDLPRTSEVPLERIPEPLRAHLAARADGATAKLGLQDAYELLELLGDEVGRRFREEGLRHDATPPSPLAARNQSILAHGFQPVSEKTFLALRTPTLALLRAMGIEEAAIPHFPTI